MTLPKANTLRDSFATTALSACWAVDNAAGAGPGLVIAGGGGSIVAVDDFDGTDCAIACLFPAFAAGSECQLSNNQGFACAHVTVGGFRLRARHPDGTQAIFVDPGGINGFRLREAGGTMHYEYTQDGGASWTDYANWPTTGAVATNSHPALISFGDTWTVTSINGGGVPHCPTVPPFVPVDGAAIAQSYTWRDAKGFTSTTAIYLRGTVAQVAGYAAALRPLLEACSDAALNGAAGPYYLDRFTFGASAHGAAIGDQLVIAGLTHRTGRAVELVVPAAAPSLFDASGAADVASGPVGALADYWQRHAVTADGEGFRAVAARRRRVGMRRRFGAAQRRPSLTGPNV